MLGVVVSCFAELRRRLLTPDRRRAKNRLRDLLWQLRKKSIVLWIRCVLFFEKSFIKRKKIVERK
jgi:hypothetical protein